jgi:glutamate-1-semialdehyde 2,1-aminomutase
MSLLERREVVHAGTFNGYHAGLAAIKATLNILENAEQNLSSMIKKSEQLQAIFKEKFQKHGLPLIMQGHPACFYIHQTAKTIMSTEDWTPEIRAKDSYLQKRLLKNGIMLAPTSRCYPSVCLSDDDLDFCDKRIEKALRECDWG